MKKASLLAITLTLSLNFLWAQNKATIVQTTYIEKILHELASDEMRGRHAFTEDAKRAADFIANEFKQIGLTPYTQDGYKQNFTLYKVSRKESSVTLDQKTLPKKEFLVLGNKAQINWNQNTQIQVGHILKNDDFATKFRTFARAKENSIVLVDPSFASFIDRFNKIYGKDNMITNSDENAPSVAFIVCDKLPKQYNIVYENTIAPIEMSNVVGILPGKTLANECVIFSGHYDHIGVIKPEGQDSIANGADDDASGIAAMISLAKYYKTQNNNARTLIFAAFTGEEVGMYGSKYFSNNIAADSVIAMINIEMIGKDSKFGPNSLYITGYERSDLGELMQKNIQGTLFTFHADPYTTQNLFYRSDNAVLAALGVPAHTFSTSQIDQDSYYHTVKDEINTLNIANIKSSIEAIAIGAKGIVDGTQTPRRVEKLKD